MIIVKRALGFLFSFRFCALCVRGWLVVDGMPYESASQFMKLNLFLSLYGGGEKSPFVFVEGVIKFFYAMDDDSGIN